MKTIKIITCFALSLFLLNCSNNKEIDGPEMLGEEVKLCAETHNIEIETSQTRAPIIKAFDNKSFQLIVRDASSGSYFTEKNSIASSQTAAGGEDESPVIIDPKLYWDDLGGVNAKLELFGVYPKKKLTDDYGYSGDNINWSVTTDINTSDLMLAYKDEYAYSKTVAANLLFEHVLTKVSINLLKGDGFDGDNLDNAIVTFNVPTTGTCNIKTKAATGTNKTTLEPTKSDGSYTILTFPFKVETPGNSYELAVITIGDNTYKVSVKDLDLQKGIHNIFNVTINKSEVTLTATLKDWDEKASTASAKLVTIGEFTITDATDAKVTDGTTIAISITDKNSEVHERTFTYNDKSWTPDTPLYWDDMAYPFTSVDALMILGGDTNKTNGDYIFTASASNVALGEAIDLGEFKHPLVKLTITVTTATGSEVTNNVNLGGITKVEINNSFLFEVSGATIAEGSTALEAVADGDSSTDYTYVTFMMPKKLTKLCDITIDEDSKNTNVYPVTLKTETSFEAGNHYKYTVEITKTKVEFTGSLVDWTIVENDDIETGL